jgi:hypothetical protein
LWDVREELTEKYIFGKLPHKKLQSYNVVLGMKAKKSYSSIYVS